MSPLKIPMWVLFGNDFGCKMWAFFGKYSVGLNHGVNGFWQKIFWIKFEHEHIMAKLSPSITVSYIHFCHNLIERTFQEKYSQVARSGKQNKFPELRFIFFGRNYRKVCRWIKRGWLSCGQHIHLSQTFLFFFSQNLFLFPRPCDLRVFLLKCTL